MKKNRIAQRARSFKEDFLDVLSTLRSPSQSSSPPSNLNGKFQPVSASPLHSSTSTPGIRRLEPSFTETLGLNEVFSKEIHSSTVKITCALKYFQDAVEKNKLEMLSGCASVVLESVSHLLTSLGNAVASGEHSSSLISATSLVHQALAHLIKWSDDILLYAIASDISEDFVVKDEVGTVVEGLRIALHDLVQLVIHKALNKTLPPPSASPITSPAVTNLRANDIFFQGGFSSPTRLSKSSDGSLLDDIRSSDCWSTDSLTDECDSCPPPPKPPLPLRSIFTDTGREFFSSRDSSPPPPLPPKKRSLAAAPPGGAARLDPSSATWGVTLPDLVPHQPWLTGSLDSLSLGSSASEVFHRRTDMGFVEQQHSVRGAGGSASTFSSSSSSSFTSSHFAVTNNSRLASVFNSDDNVVVLSVPPALPAKRRQRLIRTPSQYDNIDAAQESFTGGNGKLFHSFEESSHIDCTSSRFKLHHEFSSFIQQPATSAAPPLPPKKRNIMAYMEMVGQYSQPKAVEIFQQSMEAYNTLAADWQARNEDLFTARASSYLSNPPLLPPKKTRQPSISLPPVSNQINPPEDEPAAGNPGRRPSTEASDLSEMEGMEKLELKNELNLQSPEDDGHEVRGGTVDALILHATKLNKDDFLYQEAFLATYRTFIRPIELIRKLVKRFHHFLRKIDITFQRAARNAFSLLVRVVDDLALSELDSTLLREIMDFQGYLVSSGDLVLAKALRTKLLEKCAARRKRIDSVIPYLSSLAVSTKQNTLLDFRSAELAEQMTLLDAELFHRIEVPEVLLWAQEQNEEKTTNLNLFTEHFNKMSYWARSRILEQSEAKDRERYVTKFIKMMKHLRRLNNFNSYLAILSALDSAPVRRLEWQKSITDGLQEYCALIDSSSSFRAYRQALAETQPPCIPYIGLILQDLTFVHIGNPDLLPDGRINFAKRWQQFHILENMRRFQKCQYQFKRNEKIILFFNDFNDSLAEETMWSISEKIRPRGTNNNTKK